MGLFYELEGSPPVVETGVSVPLYPLVLVIIIISIIIAVSESVVLFVIILSFFCACKLMATRNQNAVYFQNIRDGHFPRILHLNIWAHKKSQGFILVENVYIKKSIQDQAEQREKSSGPCQLQYRMYATYTQVSLYLLFKLFHILILRETEFSPQSDNNKNAPTKIMCANSFLVLCVLNHSPSWILYISEDNFIIR